MEDVKAILKQLLPPSLRGALKHFYNNYLGGFATQSYAQEGEDLVLPRIFETQATGFYVDVGAHHPQRFSNTYFFYKKGWRGINIDAMPGSMRAFNRQRPRDVNIEKPVASMQQMLTYYTFNEPAFNGFSKALSEQRNGMAHFKIVATQEIETTTLTDLLDRYLPAGQYIDFLSVDVEGLDLDVLQSLDFKRYRPTIILVEMLGNNLAEMMAEPMYQLLTKQGYELYAKTVCTVFFKLNHSH